MSDHQEEYRKLKEEVAELANLKNSLERQVKDIRSLKKQKLELKKEVERLRAELSSLES